MNKISQCMGHRAWGRPAQHKPSNRATWQHCGSPTFELEGQKLLAVLLQVAQHLRQAGIELVWAEGEGQLGPGRVLRALPGCTNRQDAAYQESAGIYR